MNAKRTENKWFYLICGAFGMLMIGVIYAWSILKTPLAEEFGWGVTELALNFTLTLCFFCVGGVLGSTLSSRFSPRVTILTAAACLCAGFVICSRMSGASIAALYLAYGGLGGTGIGMANNAIVSQCNAWFPGQRGTSTGVLMMCFGLSSLLLGKLAAALMEIPEIGWRTTYMIIGIAIAAVLVPLAMILRMPPRSAEASPAGEETAAAQAEKREYDSREMMKRPSFWKFYAYSILTCAVGSTVISFARDLALSVGASAALATTLVGVLSLCNGLGRILFGLIFDRLGRKKTMILSNLLTIVAPATILFSLSIRSLPLSILGFCLTGIAYGSSPTISAAVVSELYGVRHYPKNYSLANTMVIFASVMSTVAGKMLELTGGSYLPVFIVLLVCAVAALFLNFRIREA